MSMMQVAKEMNLDFSERDAFELTRNLRVFELFSFFRTIALPFSDTIKNIVSGVLDDTEVYLFDHSFYEKKRGGDRTIYQTIFVVVLKDRKIPGFRFQHDRWYQMKLINRHRMPGKQGEIVFREALVRWDETETLAWEGLIPELQALLPAEAPANIELREGYLLIYQPRMLLGTERAITFFQDCCALTALLHSKDTRKPLYRWAEIQGKDY